MTFTTPCFVRVENPEKRKELIEWLEGIGYKFLMRGLESNVLYVDVTSGCLLCAFESPVTQSEMVSKGYIDCGENTELFKALAAMNDENDREQWFTDGYHFELCPTNKADMVAWHMMYRTKPRKATAEEIVEYFKNKER
jgi:hypothetical protein